MKLKKKFKQIFCMHTKWELHKNPNIYHAAANNQFVYKCVNCNKLRLDAYV